MKAATVCALAVLASLAVAVAGLDVCLIDTTVGAKESVKACHSCQWQCLTDATCTEMWYGAGPDVKLTKEELAAFDCGSLNPDYTYFTDIDLSPGLCVLLDANSAFPAFIFDTQESDCRACAHYCLYDSRCTGFVFNYAGYDKADVGTDPVAFCASLIAPP